MTFWWLYYDEILIYTLHYRLVQLDVVLASYIQDDLTTVVIQQWMMTI